MQLVHIYLNFAGNTEEAFKFYEKVFGTRILMKQPTATRLSSRARPRARRTS